MAIIRGIRANSWIGVMKKSMNKRRQKVLVANWKMKPESLKEAKLILKSIKRVSKKISKVRIVICPPIIFLSELKKISSGAKMDFGAQDIFYEERGSFTGEISVSMLVDADTRFAIIGHSERRALGETNDIVSRKLKTALRNNIKSILCVGERERDEHGEYLSFLAGEIKASLSGVQGNLIDNLVIAYEPVWAIGKNAKGAVTKRELEEVVIFIKKTLSDIYGKNKAFDIPILYGGSVEAKNAAELVADTQIDGFLVGHESLKPENFAKIAEALNSK